MPSGIGYQLGTALTAAIFMGEVLCLWTVRNGILKPAKLK